MDVPAQEEWEDMHADVMDSEAAEDARSSEAEVLQQQQLSAEVIGLPRACIRATHMRMRARRSGAVSRAKEGQRLRAVGCSGACFNGGTSMQPDGASCRQACTPLGFISN